MSAAPEGSDCQNQNSVLDRERWFSLILSTNLGRFVIFEYAELRIYFVKGCNTLHESVEMIQNI